MSGSAVSRPVAGLYGVTPDLVDTDRLEALVDAALGGGARLIQYRNKAANATLRAAQAARLAVVCARHGRPLIVNDHVELALSIPGAGLHVGADDFPDFAALRAIRERLGDARLLGVSCYRSVDQARRAVAAGADHVAFGSVFVSPPKPPAPPAALETFGQARAFADEHGIALVGIGGITRDNLPSLIAAGADAAAVISDLFDAGDPEAVRRRAQALASAFDGAAHPLSTVPR